MKKVSEYDQEIPQSQTADQPTACGYMVFTFNGKFCMPFLSSADFFFANLNFSKNLSGIPSECKTV